MSSRRASDGANSVLSFTFLDVLMCTMGSLLLLLVVFGVIVKKSTRMRREGEVAPISLAALSAPDVAKQAAIEAPPALSADAPPAGAAEELAKQLTQLRSEQADIDRLRGEAAQRRLEEQARISHLEDHERRLEHELGQLHVTLQVLEATEKEQDVDQAQAEAEVARLKELVAETEARLDEMRKAGTGEKSYAIVPYKGANGTFRQPVFVECTADAVTIQPEGIRLTVADFDGPLRSGNPLAAAIRAAHEELNGRAIAAGRTDMPDPYPLLIVRPDGAAAYAAAIDAIRSWDSDYGYEFVEADWKLKYAEPDPRLGQIMAHAVDEARQRQALLAKAAPRQYAPRLTGSGDGPGGGGGGGGDGSGFGELSGTGSGDRIGAHGGDGPLNGGRQAGNGLRSGNGMASTSGSGGSGGGNFSDEFSANDASAAAQGSGGQLAMGTNGGPGGVGGNGTGVGGTGGPGSSAVGQGAEGAQGEGDARYATTGANGQPNTAQSGQTAASGTGSSPDGTGTGAGAAGQTGPTGGSSQSAGAADTASGGASSGGSSGGGSSAGGASSSGGAGGSSAGGNAGSVQLSSGGRRGSAADTRGANWANAEAARRTSAITRPVRVVVNGDQLTVLSEGGSPSDATIVSFKQPVDGVMDQLAGAVQKQVVDWGLAGDGMYWRPTLVVSVAPGAQRQAERLAELLENSGLDIRLPQATANAAPTERQ